MCKSTGPAGLQEALRRKDAIIRVRNAQISSLWDELHTRQPWRNALGDDGKPIVFAGPADNATTKALVVLGINTVSTSLLFSQCMHSRDQAQQWTEPGGHHASTTRTACLFACK